MAIEEGTSVVTVGKTTPIAPGQATSANSIPVVVASDQTPVPILDNLSAPSQVRDDLLGFPRVQTPLAIFDDTNLIDIDPHIWAIDEAKSGSARVTQVNHVLQQSAAEIMLTPGAANGNIASLITKQSFPYQTGRITSASFGVSMSRDKNAVIEFGMFDATDGYFLRIVGDDMYYVRRTSSGERPQDHLHGYTGVGANPESFVINSAVMESQPTRTDFGTTYTLISPPNSPTIMEEIVPRRYWNGDTLVGEDGEAIFGAADPSSTHKLSLINLVMVRIEFGWYGGTGSRVMFYVPVDANLPQGEKARTARWVIAHNLNCSDRITYPSLGNPTLPMQFRIRKTGTITANTYLRKYGSQISIDGGDYSKLAIFSKDSSKTSDEITNSTELLYKPILALRVKEQITNNQNESKRNLLRVFPLQMSMVSSHRAQFVLIKNPLTMQDAGSKDVTEFTSTGTLSAIETNDLDASSNAIASFTGGDQIASFFVGQEGADTVDLTDIFSFARQYLTRESTAPAGTAGDVLVIAVRPLDKPVSGQKYTLSSKATLTWGQR